MLNYHLTVNTVFAMDEMMDIVGVTKGHGFKGVGVTSKQVAH